MSNTSGPKSLVVVVGAGAGAEANLPTGTELKQKIADALNIRYEQGFIPISGDRDIIETFSYMAQSTNPLRANIQPFLNASSLICQGMPLAISIDHFIHAHRDDKDIPLCSKLAIARCILRSEQASTLYVNPSNIYNKLNFASMKDTWFNAFWRLLTENCRQVDLVDRLSNVAIICFNYDRCIESYLFWGLQEYYGMTPDVAAQVMSNLEIHHPYGTVGTLPWQSGKNGFPFGGSPHPKKLLELAGMLRTFTEGVDIAQSDISVTRSILSSAQRIVFLGFAFHKLNLQLLFPSTESGQQPRICPVYGTAHGISDSNLQVITHQLSGFARIRSDYIKLRRDLKCSDLIDEYWWNLSLQ